MLWAQALHSMLMMIPPTMSTSVSNVFVREPLVGNPILTNRPLEVHRNQRAQITLRVLVRVVVAGESAPRIVLDLAHVLNVGCVFTLARNPHSVHLEWNRYQYTDGKTRHFWIDSISALPCAVPSVPSPWYNLSDRLACSRAGCSTRCRTLAPSHRFCSASGICTVRSCGSCSGSPACTVRTA